MWQTCAYLREAPPHLDDGIDILGGWSMPDQYVKDRSANGPYSMAKLSQWLRSGILHHKPSGTLMGGPYGWKWALLLLLRMRKGLLTQKGKRKASGSRKESERERYTEKELQILDADLEWLISEVEGAATYLMHTRSDYLPDFQQRDSNSITYDRGQARREVSVSRDKRCNAHVCT